MAGQSGSFRQSYSMERRDLVNVTGRVAADVDQADGATEGSRNRVAPAPQTSARNLSVIPEGKGADSTGEEPARLACPAHSRGAATT